ncbi:MAG: D-2-hydroxyacid dehydrogenase [Phototrophicaceae bacterium]
MSDDEKINVVVAIDFSDEIMAKIKEVSPRLNVVRHFPEVPDSVWSTTEILYTTRSFPEPDNAPLLRWIQLNYAGVNSVVKRPIAQAEDIAITSASGIHATQIANYSLMMMLAFNYRLPKMLEFQQEKKWVKNRDEVFNPHDMNKQTLGIVGYGSIARELARLADAMGMTVLATKRDAMKTAESETDYTPEGTGDPEGTIPERIYPGEALATMASECDYLVVTAPLTEQTRHMVNARVLDAMKESAVLINIARGALVDENALITALSQKKIRGAALDVFEEEPLPNTSPLWDLDNVILSPHVSGNTDNYHGVAADLFIANLHRYLENKPLYNQLNREIGY